MDFGLTHDGLSTDELLHGTTFKAVLEDRMHVWEELSARFKVGVDIKAGLLFFLTGVELKVDLNFVIKLIVGLDKFVHEVTVMNRMNGKQVRNFQKGV